MLKNFKDDDCHYFYSTVHVVNAEDHRLLNFVLATGESRKESREVFALRVVENPPLDG
jgi:hypothetical protein